jgi:hypothetical protein
MDFFRGGVVFGALRAVGAIPHIAPVFNVHALDAFVVHVLAKPLVDSLEVVPI